MAEVLKFEDLDLNGSYTYADYLLWKFEDRVELIKGKVFRMEETPPIRGITKSEKDVLLLKF